MSLFFDLLVGEAQLNFAKSAMSFGKRQRWHFNSIQLCKPNLAAAIVAIYTFINSDLCILTSLRGVGLRGPYGPEAKFRIPTSSLPSPPGYLSIETAARRPAAIASFTVAGPLAQGTGPRV